MLFYEVKTEIIPDKDYFESFYEDQKKKGYSNDLYKEIEEIISLEALRIWEENKKGCFIYFGGNNHRYRGEISYSSKNKKKAISIYAIAHVPDDLNAAFEALRSSVDKYCTLSIKKMKEITLSRGVEALQFGGYTPDEIDEEILSEFNITYKKNHRNWLKAVEYITETENTLLSEFESRARDILCEKTLIPELRRIFKKKKSPHVTGIPVQYMLCIQNKDVRDKVTEIINEALLVNHRLSNARGCNIVLDNVGELFGPSYETILEEIKMVYKNSAGSFVNVDYTKSEYDDKRNAKKKDFISPEDLCKCIREFRNTVQSCICIPGESAKTETTFMEYMGDIPVVKITDDLVKKEKAVEHLQRLAQKRNVETDDELFKELEKHADNFRGSELNDIFEKWYGKYMKTKVYPQYANIYTAEKTLAEKEPEGNAYEKLKKMTGLEEAKKVIDQAIDYFKAQKIFKDRGMKADRPAMHMIFTGNPGTAKTTVARLFAGILKDNGILSVGDLYELGRSDLVGQYVGWTAPTVKRRFKEARGSVLFIDEAYSLVDDKEGLFGDEAINTIVQEMENNREDMVVIFAGYPDKMKEFVDRNPGLKSRIAFHVPFDDYNAGELFEIAGLLAEDSGVVLDSGVKDRLLPIFEKALKNNDFGNGRFVRNLIEKAKMKQAHRLVHSDVENVTNADVKTLLAEDFEEPVVTGDTEKNVIGFAV